MCQQSITKTEIAFMKWLTTNIFSAHHVAKFTELTWETLLSVFLVDKEDFSGNVLLVTENASK